MSVTFELRGTVQVGNIEFATTLTDSAGQYMLCALDRNPPASILVFKPGYRLSGKPVVLTGDATTFDIQIRKVMVARHPQTHEATEAETDQKALKPTLSRCPE